MTQGYETLPGMAASSQVILSACPHPAIVSVADEYPSDPEGIHFLKGLTVPMNRLTERKPSDSSVLVPSRHNSGPPNNLLAELNSTFRCRVKSSHGFDNAFWRHTSLFS